MFCKNSEGQRDCKRGVGLVLLVFAFVWASDFLFHGVWMKGAYAETAHLWRTEQEMMGYMPFMFFGQFLIALFVVMFFKKYVATQPSSSVLCLGGTLGGLFGAPLFIQFAVTPLPPAMLTQWVMFVFVQALGISKILHMSKN